MDSKQKLKYFQEIFTTIEAQFLNEENVAEAKAWLNSRLENLTEEAVLKRLMDSDEDRDYEYRLTCSLSAFRQQNKFQNLIRDGDSKAVEEWMDDKNVRVEKDGVVTYDNAYLIYGFYKALKYKKVDIAKNFLKRFREARKTFKDVAEVVKQANIDIMYLEIYKELLKCPEFRNSDDDKGYMGIVYSKASIQVHDECLKLKNL